MAPRPGSRRDAVLTPVTALAFLSTTTSTHEGSPAQAYLLVGEDTQLKIYDVESRTLCREFRVFVEQPIHGIRVTSGRVLVWGSRRVAVCSTEAIEVALATETDVELCFGTGLASDWIYDGAVSPNDPDSAVLITAHNEVLPISWTDPHPGLPPPSSPPDCVLVAGGTVFGEILVWTCRGAGSARRACQVIDVLAGHEGSIFGVQLSEEVCLPNGQSLRLLASCSDDRTIRVWDVSGVSLSRGDASDNGSREMLLHEARETGIWSVKFAPIKCATLPQPALTLYSFGEDSTAQRWELDLSNFRPGEAGETGKLTNKRIFSNHDGKHLWASALTLNHDGSNLIATGGADGKVALVTDDSSHFPEGESGDEGTANMTVVSHGTLEFLEPAQGEKVQRGRNRYDFLHRYAFITPDDMLAITKFGKLLVGSFQGSDATWTEVHIADDEYRADLKAISVITPVAPGKAILGMTTRNLYLYSENTLSCLAVVRGKVLNLISLDYTGDMATFLVTMYDNRDIQIFTLNLSTREIVSDTVLPGVDERFALTSAGQFHGYLVIGSRNGFMEVFKLEDGQYVRSAQIGPRSDDAITSICPLPGQIPQGLLRHETSPPFGPQIEDAWFCGGVEGPADLILSGFRSKNFVVWNESKREMIASVDCGGAHRTFAHTKSPMAGHLRFAFTKASTVYIHSQKGANSSTLKWGTHGREIRAVAAQEPAHHLRGRTPSTSPSYFATGSEDTVIRIWQRPTTSREPREVASMNVHMTGIQSLKWCGQDYLLSSGGNEDFFVWRVSEVDASFSGLAVFCEAVFQDKSPDEDLRIMDFDVSAEGEKRLLITMAFSNSIFKTYRYCPLRGLAMARAPLSFSPWGVYRRMPDAIEVSNVSAATITDKFVVKSAHAAAINSVVGIHDGLVATVSNDQRLKIWRVTVNAGKVVAVTLEETRYSGVADPGSTPSFPTTSELGGAVALQIPSTRAT
ncbi:unnamed protein product [Parascedosporium putredinis]|uniref:WD repeat protein n=1 Tax=Parascedosporium putredinis TaxID=1442378 RepID=A0A9P1ME71_9PEZI|nr:unnamed protein product [Parascedosporium putredinis]CAI8002076.1 unnamed protein product [Parascedosporium putredinis]